MIPTRMGYPQNSSESALLRPKHTEIHDSILTKVFLNPCHRIIRKFFITRNGIIYFFLNGTFTITVSPLPFSSVML